MCIETIGGIGVDESLKSFFKKEACARAWFEDLSISQETLSKLPWSILLEQNSSKLSKRRTSQLLAHRSNSIKV